MLLMQKHAELIKNQKTGKDPRSPTGKVILKPPRQMGYRAYRALETHSTIVIANLFHCLTTPTVKNFFLMSNSNPCSLSQFPAAFRGNSKQLFDITGVTTPSI